MSNRPNDDFSDDFNFEDDFGSDSRNDLSDDLSPDFGDDSSDELPDLGDDDALTRDDQREGGGGPSRAFIILAVLMVLLFLVGLGAVIFLATRDTGPSELELTATEITIRNMTSIAGATQTNEAIIAFGATGTASALIPTNTPRPPTVTPTFTVTATNTLDPTEQAAAAFTQTAEAASFATQTAIALQSIPTETSEISLESVAQTATALAALFGQPTPTPIPDGQGGDIVPTIEGDTTGALPETGFFDDIAGGGRNGVGLVVLMGFGLVGVIFISRRLRAVSEK